MMLSRRELLASVAVSAICTSPPAKAWIRGSPIPTGRSILNGFNTDAYPFKNFLKQAGSTQSTGGYAFPANIDANGYPTIGTVTTDYYSTFLVPATYTGNWRFKWSGKCRLNFSPSQTPNTGITVLADPSGAVSGSTAFTMTVIAAGSSYIDFKFNGVCSTVQLTFKASGDFTGFSDAVLCRTSSPYTGDEAAIATGTPELQFNDDFIAVVNSLNPLILRPLDASATNNSNVSRAAYLAQSANLGYSSRWLPATWAGDTSGTDTYTCAAAPDTPVSWTDGEVIQVRFTNANTITTPTLNVNSRGAKTLVNTAGAALSAGSIPANQLATCIYDATLDKVLYSTGGLTAGWPIAILVGLANKTNKHLWNFFPHLIDDAGVTTITTYVRDNLRSHLTCWNELSNEIWNFIFAQTNIYKARGAALGFSAASNRQEFGYYGLRFRQIMGIVTTAWASRATTMKRVMPFQAYGSTSNNNTYRFQGADLGAYGYNSAPNRPIDYSDCLSYAPYYTGAILRGFDARYTGEPALTAGDKTALTAAADNYATGIPANIASAFSWIDNDVRAGTSGAGSALGVFTLSYQNTNIFPAWNTIAVSYGLPIVYYEDAYEGAAPSTGTCTTLGISTSYGGASGLIGVMLAAYKNNILFKQLVLDQWGLFMAFPSGLYPSWFVLDGGVQWSMYPTGGIYVTPYQSFNAMQDYNA